jgi:hypothetical protein
MSVGVKPSIENPQFYSILVELIFQDDTTQEGLFVPFSPSRELQFKFVTHFPAYFSFLSVDDFAISHFRTSLPHITPAHITFAHITSTHITSDCFSIALHCFRTSLPHCFRTSLPHCFRTSLLHCFRTSHCFCTSSAPISSISSISSSSSSSSTTLSHNSLRELMFQPAKPVKLIHVFVVLRNLYGSVYFQNITVRTQIPS